MEHVHDYDELTGACYCGDVWDEDHHTSQSTPPAGDSPVADGVPTDMFGNDLSRTDSFGAPRDLQVWVGRTEGPSETKVSFKTVQEAEHFLAQLEMFFPEEVRAGNFYIDAPEVAHEVRGMEAPIEVDHAKCAAALAEGIEALRDIINAADNNQPYSAKELEQLFSPALEQMRAAVGDD